ncbi:PREDICTED: uncharacterized protein LOC105625785 [Atta cephalotes]|uniref:EGF-like calcium-binding domain-containing protein n=1 Tax=Atta cephalotes TaxID=12957 RepID=A0A158NY85_ATTCE|nr:PREDICTED: uncharacterized protein LOC105625785 [Atta cephalotes]
MLASIMVNPTVTPLPPTIESTIESTITDLSIEEKDKVEMPSVPLIEQVMDHNIRVSDVPDVDPEATNVPESSLDRNRVIRDVAYFIRAHKFHDYDHRYFKSAEEATSKLYEEFPKPGLRSLHWEVHKHCEASFVECLKYLERIIKLTVFRRENDTVTIMRKRKWNLMNNTEQIMTVQRDCQTAQREDNLIVVPFQGPIERFQWRTTVSYYMCWYTMLGVPDLATFGEPCDNHANCLDEYDVHNKDPRADDTKPYACALYSFCPDHCCPMKHIRYMKDCYQSQSNPCYAENQPAHRKCTLNRDENRDFQALRTNQINVSCECHQRGYEWSSRFGLCVDVNECVQGTHNCTQNAESCLNLPGYYVCVCRLGYIYNSEIGQCVHSPDIDRVLKSGYVEKPKVAKTRNMLDKIARIIARSTGSNYVHNYRINFSLILIILILNCKSVI